MNEKLKFPYVKLSDDTWMDMKSLLEMLKNKNKKKKKQQLKFKGNRGMETLWKREGFGYVRTAFCWHWGSCTGLTWRGAASVFGLGCIIDFLGLILIQKQRQKLGTLSVINQVLAICSWLLEKLLLASWIGTRDNNQVSSKSDL